MIPKGKKSTNLQLSLEQLRADFGFEEKAAQTPNTTSESPNKVTATFSGTVDSDALIWPSQLRLTSASLRLLSAWFKVLDVRVPDLPGTQRSA